MIKENQRTLNLSLVILDALCGGVAMFLAWYLRVGQALGFPGATTGLLSHLLLLLLLLPANGLSYYFIGLYRPSRRRRFTREFFLLAAGVVVGLGVGLCLLAALNWPAVLAGTLLLYSGLLLLLNGIARYLLRLGLRRLRSRGFNLKYLMVVGTGPLAKDFVDRIRDNPQYGYRFYGCLSDRDPSSSLVGDLPVLGLISTLSRHLETGSIDEVVVAIELYEYENLPEVIAVCEKCGVKVNIVPAYYRYVPSNPQMEELDGLPVMALRKIPLSNPVNAFFKRAFDIVVSLFCIVLFSPVMLAAWAITRRDTGEPAIFRQERVGLGFKPFTMYKFRTMRSAPVLEPAAAGGAPPEPPGESGDETPHWTTMHDDRRTRSGVILRRFSIDELPQFFNVLSGKMSIVGPRPELPAFVEKFREEIPRYMVRHQVKPGITGWSQIRGLRGDTSIEERIRSDLHYIENWSLALDIQIIVRTFLHAFYNPYE